MVFFEDRYTRLVHPDADTVSRKRRRILFYVINYSVVFTCTIPAFMDLPSDQESHMTISNDFSCLPASIINTPGFFMLNTHSFVIGGILFAYFMFCGLQAFYFVSRTLLYLYGIKSQSRKTSRLQKQLFKAFCIQMTVPFILLIIPCTYILFSIAFNYLDMILNNISMIWLSSHSLFSTVTMLVVHKSYRDAVIGLVACKEPSKPNSVQNISVLKL
uniref:Serpentine Receptor, class H n=1 Tax=Caenorhabditis tropicalis TaxID=1561998 RepID=A0A1I7T6M0_9PELO